jgi:divalent metal cation (Fe/Co/Zn/Cd) transporter
MHRRPVHHVTVQHLGDRLAVSLDLEVDGQLSLKEGHAIASELEDGIAAELGPGVEVETHLEPLDVQDLHGRDVSKDKLERIAAALAARASQDDLVSEIHDVRARPTEAGLVVNFHCTMSPECSIAEMHAHVDDIERSLRKEMPEIVRVVGHAEPTAALSSA